MPRYSDGSTSTDTNNYGRGGSTSSVNASENRRGNTTSHGLSYGTPDPRYQNPSTWRGNDNKNRNKTPTNNTPDSRDEERRRREAEAARIAAIEANRKAAVGSRNTAVKTMMDAINTAFGDEYNTEYYDDRTSAFNAFANPLLTSGYDDSLRGIYEGFREAGIFDTNTFNTQKGALDTARTTETTRLGTLAKAYNQRVKDAVAAAKTGVTGDLAKLYGDDTVSAKDAAAQQSAVEGFTYGTDITTPEFTRKDDPDTEVDETISAPVFFRNFRKLSDQGGQTAPNQAASGRTPQAAASGRMSTRNFNFQNPVSQGSSRIIG